MKAKYNFWSEGPVPYLVCGTGIIALGILCFLWYVAHRIWPGFLDVGLSISLLVCIPTFYSEFRREIETEKMEAEQQRVKENRCVQCGYSLNGLPHRICPECGYENPALSKNHPTP